MALARHHIPRTRATLKAHDQRVAGAKVHGRIPHMRATLKGRGIEDVQRLGHVASRMRGLR